MRPRARFAASPIACAPFRCRRALAPPCPLAAAARSHLRVPSPSRSQLAKTYPNDEIEVISVESQVVAGTNWRVEVEVQASEPVAYTAVVFQALPFAGGNFTLTSLTRM